MTCGFYICFSLITGNNQNWSCFKGRLEAEKSFKIKQSGRVKSLFGWSAYRSCPGSEGSLHVRYHMQCCVSVSVADSPFSNSGIKENHMYFDKCRPEPALKTLPSVGCFSESWKYPVHQHVLPFNCIFLSSNLLIELFQHVNLLTSKHDTNHSKPSLKQNTQCTNEHTNTIKLPKTERSGNLCFIF